MNILALAEVPQMEKRSFWRLRESRKWKKVVFGACGSPANEKSTFWRLREFRKWKINFLALAEVPQALLKTPGDPEQDASRRLLAVSR